LNFPLIPAGLLLINGLVSLAIAETPSAPQRFQVSGKERPISEIRIQTPSSPRPTAAFTASAQWGETSRRRIGETAAPTSRGWRQPAESRPMANRDRQHRAAVAWSDVRGGGLGSYVRPASQLSPVDPFEDPFGDQAREAFPEAAPTAPQTQQELEQQPAPVPPADDAPAADEDEAPPIPRSFDPLPAFPSRGPYPKTNGRDCNEELSGCQRARDYVKANSIKDISLDVTPLLTRAQLVDEEGIDYEQELEKEMSKAPSRIFRDKSGEVIAEGRLSDFRNGRVLIAGDDGSVSELPFDELSESDSCFVAAWWSIPTECALGDEQLAQREWVSSTLTWKASGVCHKPLYFEEPALERYGHSSGPVLQPLLSGAHFFGNVIALPYNLGLDPPNECEYPLGRYRPGSCAPYLVPPVPVSIRAGLLTAGLYTGGVFVIP
jgi:hypothetical protein